MQTPVVCHWSFKTSESRCCGVLFCTPAALVKKAFCANSPTRGTAFFLLTRLHLLPLLSTVRVTHPFLTPKPVRGQIFHLIRNSVEGEGSFEALVIKNPPASEGDMRDSGSIPGLGRSPGVGNSSPLKYSYLGNPWTEESRGLQSMRLQRVRHDWTRAHTHTHTHTRFCQFNHVKNRIKQFEEMELWRWEAHLDGMQGKLICNQ